MKALLDGDIVTGRGTGIVAPEIPPELEGLPDERLRFDGAAIIDVGGRQQWHIDALGQKHIVSASGRQAITCAWDAKLVRDGSSWRVGTAADARAPGLKRECQLRILAEISDATQKNLTAYAADLGLKGAGNLSAAETSDVETMRAARGWIQAMLEVCRTAIATGEEAAWPPLPDGVAEIAARF